MARRDRNKLNKTLARIAAKHLWIETLETRKSDSLDFHEVAVWCLKDALEAAYLAGVEAAEAKAKRKAARANSRTTRATRRRVKD